MPAGPGPETAPACVQVGIPDGSSAGPVMGLLFLSNPLRDAVAALRGVISRCGAGADRRILVPAGMSQRVRSDDGSGLPVRSGTGALSDDVGSLFPLVRLRGPADADVEPLFPSLICVASAVGVSVGRTDEP